MLDDNQFHVVTKIFQTTLGFEGVLFRGNDLIVQADCMTDRDFCLRNRREHIDGIAFEAFKIGDSIESIVLHCLCDLRL